MLITNAVEKLKKAGFELIKSEKFGQEWKMGRHVIDLLLTDSDGCQGPNIEPTVVHAVFINGYVAGSLASSIKSVIRWHNWGDGPIDQSYRKDEVKDVATVAEFLAKYYRPERYTGRTKATGWDDGYAARLLESYEKEFVQRGYTAISHHDSVTGKVVAFYGQN